MQNKMAAAQELESRLHVFKHVPPKQTKPARQKQRYKKRIQAYKIKFLVKPFPVILGHLETPIPITVCTNHTNS